MFFPNPTPFGGFQLWPQQALSSAVLAREGLPSRGGLRLWALPGLASPPPLPLPPPRSSPSFPSSFLPSLASRTLDSSCLAVLFLCPLEKGQAGAPAAASWCVCGQCCGLRAWGPWRLPADLLELLFDTLTVPLQLWVYRSCASLLHGGFPTLSGTMWAPHCPAPTVTWAYTSLCCPHHVAHTASASALQGVMS